MKWFKHISDSLDDPFIYDLMEHCNDGYLVFFGVIEIYAREFKSEPDWKLDISWAYLRQKLHRTRNKPIQKALSFIQVLQKWDIVLTDDRVSIHIPKFTELLDNWQNNKISRIKKTNKLLASKEVEVEVEVEVDKDIKKKVTKQRQQFSIPSLEEVKAYCQERNNSINPQQFLNYYQAKGWMIGQNKMKDWKAAVRTWEQRDESPKGTLTPTAIYTPTKQDEAEWEKEMRGGK
jgi:hypothetical protein